MPATSLPDLPELPISRLNTIEDLAFEWWLSSLRSAYLIAKGRRLGQLRGTRAPSYDARGVHPYSEQWGRIHAFEALLPWLTDVREGCDAYTLRREAQADADREFAQEILEKHGKR